MTFELEGHSICYLYRPSSYLSSTLMAGPQALGVIEGIAEATSSLLKLFSGVLADKTVSSIIVPVIFPL